MASPAVTLFFFLEDALRLESVLLLRLDKDE
jgi:hypothetical protein